MSIAITGTAPTNRAMCVLTRRRPRHRRTPRCPPARCAPPRRTASTPHPPGWRPVRAGRCRAPWSANGLRDGVLGPCAVICERHQLHAKTVRHVAAPAIGTRRAGPAGGHDHPIALGPAGDACAQPGYRPGCLVALRHHRPLRREGTVDEAEVRMADPAERNLDEYLARAGLGYRNIIHHNCFGVGIETLGPHRVNHFAPFAATLASDHVPAVRVACR